MLVNLSGHNYLILPSFCPTLKNYSHARIKTLAKQNYLTKLCSHEHINGHMHLYTTIYVTNAGHGKLVSSGPHAELLG